MDTVVRTLDETMRFADCVVGKLKESAYAGERAVVLTLSGSLGVGKTAFVKCLAGLLGVTDMVTSPTFVIRSDYDTQDEVFARLIHIDAYRFESPSEVETVGWDTVLCLANTLVVVEWPERISGYLPDDVCTVSMRFSDTSRVFSTDLLTMPVV